MEEEGAAVGKGEVDWEVVGWEAGAGPAAKEDFADKEDFAGSSPSRIFGSAIKSPARYTG